MAAILSLAEKLGRFALRRRGFESRAVRTCVGNVHAYVAPGDGPIAPVVMMHGIGSAATPFGPVLARVRKHARRVTAPELPGHGFSDVPTMRMTPDLLTDAMREALDQLIDEPAVLCGNSLGGAVALRYAIDRPAKVRALVLVSPAGARFSEAELDALRRSFAVGNDRDTVAFLERLYHRPPWFVPLVAGEVRELMHRRVVRDLLLTATPEHAPTAAEIGAITAPTLLLWGQSERLLPATGLAYFRANLPPHAVIEEPQGVGHCPHFDDPAALAARIVAFARSVA